MTHHRVLAILTFAVVLATTALAMSAQARVHTVQRILLDGRPVTHVNGVTVSRGGSIEHVLQRGETILDGTRIDVPHHVEVVVISTGGKSTTTLDPGASVTFMRTGLGELVRINAGHVTFNVVPGTLAFFHVLYGEKLMLSAAMTATAEAATYCNSRAKRSSYRRLHDCTRAAALIGIGLAQDVRGRYAGALTSYRAAFAIYQRVGDVQDEGKSLESIGTVQEQQADYVDALASYRQALAAYERIGNAVGVTELEQNIARLSALISRTPGPSPSPLPTPAPSPTASSKAER